jgi:hypothetical protein
MDVLTEAKTEWSVYKATDKPEHHTKSADIAVIKEKEACLFMLRQSVQLVIGSVVTSQSVLGEF